MSFLPEALFTAGRTDLISVIPPGGQLQPSSKISPSQVGKIPGRRGSNGLWAGYNWRAAAHTVEDVQQWQRDGANVGLRADRFPGVDIDCTDESLAGMIQNCAIATLGDAPVRVGLAPKRLLMYSTDVPFGRMRLWIKKGETSHLVEILGSGQQYLVYGTHPKTLRPYAWDENPASFMLTPITVDQARAFLDELERIFHEVGGFALEREGDGRAPTHTPATEQKDLHAPSLEVLRDAMRAIPNTSELFPDRTSYLKIGYAIRAASGEDTDEGCAIFAEWAEKWIGNDRMPIGNDPQIVLEDWRRMKGPYSVGWHYIAEQARMFGYETVTLEFDAVPEDKSSEAPATMLCHSDQWLADVIALRTRGTLRYVPQTGKYLCWDGARWVPDAELLAEDLIKRELRVIAIEASKHGATAKELKASEATSMMLLSAGKVTAVAQLLRSERSIAVSQSSLDHNRWQLNTPSGIVDLKTGLIGPADPDALCTKATSVGPSFTTECPRWLEFLRETTQGDDALIAYLQRLSGYALTGSTEEQQLTFVHGSGGNGKGVFLNVLGEILNDYHHRAAMDVFTASHSDKHSTGVAALVGMRLVTASETSAGKRWDEALVKSLTGGDPISARFMRQDNFTFLPQFKLLFIGNHKPEIRDVDEAMRRRIQMVPFVVKPTTVDTRLGEKLRDEFPAILAWMIRGCLAWQLEGLNPPTTVQVATKSYFADEDATGRWIEDCCTLTNEGATETQVLFESWREWANQNNEYVGSVKRFSSSLVSKNLGRWLHPTTRRKGFEGIRVNNRHDFEIPA